jgi:enolase-phosphatase E1
VTALPPAAIITDIEGTTTPIAFVRDVLFPYARTRLPAWVDNPAPEVAGLLAEVRAMVPEQPPLTTLLHWMDQDAKVTPLKALQGMIWNEGYAEGTLKGALYPDVGPCLRRWSKAGLRLHVYSSGSVEAQKLIFGHSVDGDLSGLFAGFFDTRIGGKRDADSYGRLAIGMNVPTVEVLFLSDVEAELDAAEMAGLRTCHVVRPEDGTVASDRHPVAADFPGVAAQFGLPGA